MTSETNFYEFEYHLGNFHLPLSEMNKRLTRAEITSLDTDSACVVCYHPSLVWWGTEGNWNDWGGYNPGRMGQSKPFITEVWCPHCKSVFISSGMAIPDEFVIYPVLSKEDRRKYRLCSRRFKVFRYQMGFAISRLIDDPTLLLCKLSNDKDVDDVLINMRISSIFTPDNLDAIKLLLKHASSFRVRLISCCICKKSDVSLHYANDIAGIIEQYTIPDLERVDSMSWFERSN